MSKEKVVKVIVGSVVLLLLIIGVIIGCTGNVSPPDQGGSLATTGEYDVNDVIVEIKGEVNRPGIYTVPSFAIISDVISLAKGFTNDAYTDDINLAQKVTDGLTIFVKRKTSDNNSQKININTATIDELKTLPGIAEAKATAIMTYRSANGTFSSIEDIMKVSGISENLFNKIKDYITV